MWCFKACTPALKRKVCPTMTTFLISRAVRQMSLASAGPTVIGFSTRTCLPARRASLARAWWEREGVAMTKASMDGSSISRRWSS